MQIEYHESSTPPVLVVTGEIDLASAPQLSDALVPAVAASHDLVVDLSGVTFLDSSGLNVFVQVQQTQRQTDEQFQLRLVVTRDAIRRVFDVTGLTQVFALYDSLDAVGSTG